MFFLCVLFSCNGRSWIILEIDCNDILKNSPFFSFCFFAVLADLILCNSVVKLLSFSARQEYIDQDH